MELAGPLVCLQSSIEVVHLVQGLSQIEVCAGSTRIELNSATQVRDGRGPESLADQHEPEIEMTLGAGSVEQQRLAEIALRLGVARDRSENRASVHEYLSVGRLISKAAVESLDGLFMLSGLIQEESEIVAGLDPLRIQPQQLIVDPHGPAGLAPIGRLPRRPVQ